jgi:hypothetical protein
MPDQGGQDRLEETGVCTKEDSMSTYLFDHAAPQASQRFASLETLYDPWTIRHLETTGIGPGWQSAAALRAMSWSMTEQEDLLPEHHHPMVRQRGGNNQGISLHSNECWKISLFS